MALNAGRFTPSNLIKLAAVAAIYVVLTVAIAPLSYGPLQLRFAEALVLLCFYKKDYAYAMIVGCLIANILSQYGAADVVFGTLGTLVAVLCISHSKKLWVASLFPTVANAVFVGLMLFIFYDLPLWLSMLQIAAGEFIVVTIIGVPLFKLLEKNKAFMKLIT